MQGKTINGFILQQQIGVGGMAEVWYATNEIGMAAAVKILSKELSNNERMKNRFFNEATVMVQLDHPNIRKVLGFGSIDERPAIIMEYLDGSDLKMKMRRGLHFTDHQLRLWWNQLVDALAYTHSQNIVHRDIKPSNIFINQKGDAKLLDFGIAKVIDTSSGTRTGASLGTRIYMSPEQVRDPKRVGAPSDAYSLAISFVHLISGIAPYDVAKSTDYDIQVSIVNEPIDLSGIPEVWREMLEPYLQKDPEKRPALRRFVMETKPTVEEHEGEAKSETATNDAAPSTENDALELPEGKQKLKVLLPWIVAWVAIVLAVLALMIGGSGGGSKTNEKVVMIKISSPTMNYVYAGIDVPITINGPKDIEVTATNANLTKIKKGSFKLRAESGTKSAKIIVKQKIDTLSEILGEQTFDVRELPKPVPMIDNVKNGKITTQSLLAANCVKAVMMDNALKDIRYKVQSYSVRYISDTTMKLKLDVDGSNFTEDLKKTIKAAKVGDFFIFTNIRVDGYDKDVKELESTICVEITKN